VIDEQSSLDASLPRTRSRSRLSVDSEAPNSRPTTPTARVRSKRATSLVPTTESPSARRLLRRNSEPPAAVGMQQPVRKPRAGGVRSRKTSQTDQNLSASPAPADEPPLVTEESATAEEERPRPRRVGRRRISDLSDQSAKAAETDAPATEATSSRTSSRTNSANSTTTTKTRELRPRTRRNSKSDV